MGIQNPFGDNGQSGRADDIKAEFASGAITQEQFDDLMSDEGVTSNYLNLKRAGLGILLFTVGAFILWANL